MFPHGRNLSADTVEGLQATLCYNIFGECPLADAVMRHANTPKPRISDKTTSPTSVLPYNYDDAERLLRVFENVKASSCT